MKTNSLKSICSLMECNGYAYFNNEAFLSKSDKPCYVPENADSIEEVFSYQLLLKEVENWAENNQDYLTEHETNIESIVNWMYEELTWEFPSTWLDSLNL